MKKPLFIGLMVLTMLVVSLVPALAMPGDHEITKMYVKTSNGGGLNMRQDQSTSSKALTKIPYGAEVTLYEYSSKSKWVRCLYGEYDGFVMTRYLSKKDPSAQTEPAATPAVGTEASEYKRMEPANYYASVRPSVPTGFVHMRWAPSTKEPIFRNYYDGQVLRVLYQTKNWCQVYDEESGVFGYMARSFLNYLYDVPADQNVPIGQGVTVNVSAPIGQGAAGNGQ